MADINRLIDKGGSVLRDAAGRADRFARYAGGVARGLQHRATGSRAAREMDDATLQRKVESIVFRPAGVPKGSVDVNVADGVVYLRGEVRTPKDVKELESAVRAVPEVRGVENLLHLPKTPAPTRADAPRSQQKTRRTAPRSAAPRAGRRSERVSTERAAASAEPGPAELAAERRGRQPAPLGAEPPATETQAETDGEPPRAG